VAAAYDAGSDDNISVAIAEYGGVPRDDSATTQVLAYDPVAGAAGVGVEKERDSSMEGPSSSPTSSTASAPVDESAVVGGLPLAALAAILVVGVLVAILIFGG
jgi:hypothetical protein